MTRTHAFFAIMGGFHLFKHNTTSSEKRGTVPLPPMDGWKRDNSSPVHPLSIDDLHPDIHDFIVPTIEEIKDKSKSDWLAKTLVVLQTTWFVVQCIARAIERLPITQLEVVTIAYATISLAMYIAWWDKPLNVMRPVRVYRKDGGKAGGNPGPLYHPLKSNWATVASFYILGEQDKLSNLAHEERVPVFWSDCGDLRQDLYPETATRAAGVTLRFGVIFGAIHCAAWSFLFPSPMEQLIWRTCAILITAIPLILLASGAPFEAILRKSDDFHKSPSIIIKILGFFNLMLLLPAMILSPLLYIAARGMTVRLAFMELSSLSQEAYQTVQWASFIPRFWYLVSCLGFKHGS